jgi:hypothetical protein
MTLKPKTTYNKTICLPAFACFTGESFNGWVVKRLDSELPHLDPKQDFESLVDMVNKQEGQP